MQHVANLRYHASSEINERTNAPFFNVYYLLILILGILGLALYLYSGQKQPLTIYREAIKAAMASHHYEKAAGLAFKAEHQAQPIEDKRYFFFLALDALLKNKQYDLAMQLALKNLEPLQNDVLTYQLLTEYALKAGHPQLAQKLVLRLLALQGITRPL